MAINGGRHLTVTVGAAMMGLFLVGCSVGHDEVVVETVVVTMTDAAGNQPADPEPAFPVTEPTTDVTESPQTNEVVGGGIPADATEIHSVKYPPYGGNPEAVFVTPSKNIGCAITNTGLSCRVGSYGTTAPIGRDPLGGGIDTMGIKDGVARLGTYKGSDVPPWGYRAYGAQDTVVAQTVNYGESVYYESIVCRSLETDLTCWDINTGQGLTMNRDSTTVF